MKYALYIILGLIVTNILIITIKRLKYNKVMKKNKSIVSDDTVDLNDETASLNQNNTTYNLDIEKNIVVVHSSIIVD